jgi:exosortase/archaeosortase family protein
VSSADPAREVISDSPAPAAPTGTPQTRIWLILPAVQFAAFWAVWQWVAQRLVDIPENITGAVALFVAVGLVVRAVSRGEIAVPRMGIPIALMIAYAVSYPFVPPHIGAGLAMASIGFLLGSMMGAGIRAGLVGLLVLALPIIPSMQTHIGYPMRVAGAVVVSWWLHLLGFVVVPEGTCLRWGTNLVLIDEPCSGVKMLWSALVLSCALAGWSGLNGRRTLAAALGATAVVFAANILRETSLFLLQAVGRGTAEDPMHMFLGLAVFGVAAIAIAWMVSALAAPSLKAASTQGDCQAECAHDGPSNNRATSGKKPVLLAMLAVCAVAALVPLLPLTGGVDLGARAAFPGWPVEFDGAALTQLPLGSMERRYYSSMAGHVARFGDGHNQIVLRWLGARDPKFHLSERCYRAYGYTITRQPGLLDDQGRRWGVFDASLKGEKVRVRERVWDTNGQQWTDEAAFRWDMFWRRPVGPWWSATIVETTVP